MKILISIGHIAQLNFYLNAIRILSSECEIFLAYVNRGKLPYIINKEVGLIPNVKTQKFGAHKGTKVSILFQQNFLGIIKLIWITYKFRPNIEFSNGFIAGIGPKLFRIPSCHFQDDPEIGKLRMWLMNLFADKIYIPFYPETNKIKNVNALKEWAYLSPKYFFPQRGVLIEYSLKEKEYIFVREVITSTFNYHGQEKDIIETISKNFPLGIDVVLSLEDKSRRNMFPSNWIVLEEPVRDIHSLIYFSKALISSGDSMAREGAQLGVPSIYCGFRIMHANKVLINEGVLFHKKKSEVVNTLMDILEGKIEVDQESFRNKLYQKWDDITELILNEVNQVNRKIK